MSNARVNKHRCLTESGEVMDVYTRGTAQEKAQGNWVFYVMDYFATGEGRTLMFLIDRDNDEKKTMQDFVNFCGPYYSAGIEQLPKEKFLEKYESFLPAHVKTMLNHPEGVNNMRLLQELHFNLS